MNATYGPANALQSPEKLLLTLCHNLVLNGSGDWARVQSQHVDSNIAGAEILTRNLSIISTPKTDAKVQWWSTVFVQSPRFVFS